MNKVCHIIYGYREIAKPHRWYIGAKLHWRKKNRDYVHRRALDDGKFHNFIRKAYRDGKSFDDVLEYFELETFFGTHIEADEREKHYTKLYNALSPNGFNLQAGMYNGERAEEAKDKVRGDKNPAKRPEVKERIRQNHPSKSDPEGFASKCSAGRKGKGRKEDGSQAYTEELNESRSKKMKSFRFNEREERNKTDLLGL